MLNLIANQTVLNPINKGFNKLLSLDSNIANKLTALEGKVLAIESITSPATLYLTFSKQGVYLATTAYTPIDAILSTSNALLVRLLLTPKKESLLSHPKIIVLGDSSFIYHFFRVLDSVEKNWEQELTKWINPSIAKHITKTIKASHLKLSDGFHSLHNQLTTVLNKTSAPQPKSPVANIINALQNKFGLSTKL